MKKTRAVLYILSLFVVLPGFVGLLYVIHVHAVNKSPRQPRIVAFRISANGSLEHTHPLVWFLEFKCKENGKALVVEAPTRGGHLDVAWPPLCKERARVKLEVATNWMQCEPITDRWITVQRPTPQRPSVVNENIRCSPPP